MPTTSAKKTLAWANESIEELHSVSFDIVASSVCTGFYLERIQDDGPVRAYIEFDMQSIEKIEKHCNNASNNIRHSFDQVMYGIAKHLVPDFDDDLYFPWATTRNDMVGKLNRKAPWLPEELITLIDGLRPYSNGGDDRIRKFAQAINPNKHRAPLALDISGLMSDLIIEFHAGEKVDMRVEIPIDQTRIENGRQLLFTAYRFGEREVFLEVLHQFAFAEGVLAGRPAIDELRYAAVVAQNFIASVDIWLEATLQHPS